MKKHIAFKLNIVILLALLFLVASIAFGIDTAKLKIIPTAGCNLTIVEETAANIYSLKLTSDVHNWFAGVFEGFDTKNPVTFNLNMTDTEGDVSKWEGLYPVYSYGKYFDYNTYIYYIKNSDGYWVSSDPFSKGEAKFAGNGEVPNQSAIPAIYAEEFLSEDKKYWSALGEITDTTVLAGINGFRMTNKFNSPDAFVAMKYPYNYDYQLEYIKKLKLANIPGVTVHNIGKSAKNHELFVVEICDPSASLEELKDRRVVLIYANEDGNEPDSSWVAQGALNFLISQNDEVKKILKEVTFLIIPMLDPVGWSNSTYGEMAYDFKYKGYNEYHRPEILAYTTFINKWCGHDKKRIDLVINLHNIECNEGPNIMSPLLDTLQYSNIMLLNKFLKLAFNNWAVNLSTVWLEGYTDKRFMGWISKTWGSIPVLYEINSRYPQNRLNLADLDNVGKDFVTGLYNYFDSNEYERALPGIEHTFANQTKKIQEFVDNNNITKEKGLVLYYNLEKGFYFP